MLHLLVASIGTFGRIRFGCSHARQPWQGFHPFDCRPRAPHLADIPGPAEAHLPDGSLSSSSADRYIERRSDDDSRCASPLPITDAEALLPLPAEASDQASCKS